jgi:AcrR family transcriptional regulator
MNVSRRTADETRQCILVAAWDLFRQVGFRKTTVADIAGALGMSSANIYRFFASKDALTEAICGNLLDALIEAARTAASGPGAHASQQPARPDDPGEARPRGRRHRAG